jgi:hypothetical protein
LKSGNSILERVLWFAGFLRCESVACREHVIVFCAKVVFKNAVLAEEKICTCLGFFGKKNALFFKKGMILIRSVKFFRSRNQESFLLMCTNIRFLDFSPY